MEASLCEIMEPLPRMSTQQNSSFQVENLHKAIDLSLRCGRPKIGFLDFWESSCCCKTIQKSREWRIGGPWACDEKPMTWGSQTLDSQAPLGHGSWRVGNDGVELRKMMSLGPGNWELQLSSLVIVFRFVVVD